MTGTWARYATYLRTSPGLVVEWRDPESGARGWMVINSLRGGAAGGGTRMRRGLGREEVVYLAKTMELKFAFSGPPIGGAKSGIDFDPADTHKGQVLSGWFRAVAPYLKECYGTGGDLNVDELREVIPNCASLGIRHPQQGIVRGHLQPGPTEYERIMGSLNEGIRAPLTDGSAIPGLDLTVGDTTAGYGLARGIARLYERWGEELSRARVVVEGFGVVGASCALNLARCGARVIAVADAEKVLLEPGGLEASDIEELLRGRERGLLPDDPRVVRGDDRGLVWEQPADVYVSAARSGMVGPSMLDRLAGVGVSVIACGANQPFREAALGATEVQQEADRRFAIIADVVGSAGTACSYAYLMRSDAVVEPASIYAAIDRTLGAAIDEIADRVRDRRTGLLEATLALALNRLETSAA